MDISINEKHFIPRVPLNRLIEEDKQTKRICLSSSIEKCLSSFPYKTKLKHHVSRSEPTLISVFSLEEKNFRENFLKNPEDIKNYVPDALLNDEHWALKSFTSVPTLIKLKQIDFAYYCKYTNHYDGTVTHLDYEKEIEAYEREGLATFYCFKIYKQFIRACAVSGIKVLNTSSTKEHMYYSGHIASSKLYTVHRAKYIIPSDISAKHIWTVIQRELDKNKRKRLCLSNTDFY